MTSPVERPVYFAADQETLFGVITEPTSPIRDVGVLAITGGGWMPSTGRNALHVRMARRLADIGFRVMRFDFHGVGESTGRTDRFALQEPHTKDAVAALETINSHEADASVLVGTCFGGRTAAEAATVTPKAAGVVLIAVPLREPGQGRPEHSVGTLAKRALSRKVLSNLASRNHRRLYLRIAWKRASRPFRRRGSGPQSSRYLRNLTALVETKTPILMLFGDADRQYAEYLEDRQGRLSSLFAEAGDLIEVKIVPGRLHGFPSAEAQEHALNSAEEWIIRRFS